MKNMDVIKKFSLVSLHLNEKTRQIWATIEAKTFGRGGVTILSVATNLSRSTIYLRLKDLKSKRKIDIEKIRNSGGGRKKLIEKYKILLSDLEEILEPATRGDPK